MGPSIQTLPEAMTPFVGRQLAAGTGEASSVTQERSVTSLSSMLTAMREGRRPRMWQRPRRSGLRRGGRGKTTRLGCARWAWRSQM
jgi:hypothetical protein